VAFSLLYIGMSRILGLVMSPWRMEPDKDIEIMMLRHQVRISNAGADRQRAASFRCDGGSRKSDRQLPH
jgi:hypothetical protein